MRESLKEVTRWPIRSPSLRMRLQQVMLLPTQEKPNAKLTDNVQMASGNYRHSVLFWQISIFKECLSSQLIWGEGRGLA